MLKLLDTIFESGIRNYAETHFKFKLPWSPLFRKDPEILLDAPRRITPNAECPLRLIIKDAHRFPATILSVNLDIRGPENFQQTRLFDLNFAAQESFHFEKLAIKIPKVAGEYTINAHIRIKNARGQEKSILNWNYPGLPAAPLKVYRMHEEYPWPEGWISGDLHTHSTYSSDPVEFGGDIAFMQEAATAVGLDFFALTDHSYDFYYDSTEYMREISPQDKWAEQKREIAQLDPSKATVIQSEEVSCGNSEGKNVHLLVFGHPDFISGQGDGGRRWFNNKPDLTIPEVLEQAQSSGAVCYAAHPGARIGRLEGFVFNRGVWSPKDIHPGLHGLQILNGSKDLSYQHGRALWVQNLVKGNRLHAAAGSDAHGDLNRFVAVKLPMFSLRTGEEHIFGHARTLIQSPDKSPANILKGLREGPVVISEGPWIEVEYEKGRATIHLKSTKDFGVFRRVVLFQCFWGQSREQSNFIEPSVMELTWEPEINLGVQYIRVEAHTDQGYSVISAVH